MNTKSYDIIIYGGAFNPPHAGHVDVMRRVANQGNRLYVVPSYKHPYGKVMAPFDLRVRWLSAIAAQLAEEGIDAHVERCEQDISVQSAKAVYTWDLLHYIAKRDHVDPARIAFVIGEDNRESIMSFYKGQELLETFGILVAPEQIPLHSTLIREACAQGQILDTAWIAAGLSEHDYRFYG